MHARYEKSRKALFDAAVEVLSINPSASLGDIAAKANVGRATLYRHFSSRQELVRELAMDALEVTDRVLQPLRDNPELTGKMAIEASLHAIMPLADRYHFLMSLWVIAEHDEMVMEIYNRQLSELGELVEQAKADDDIAADIPSDWVVAAIDALLARAWWMIKSVGMEPDKVAHLTIRTVFGGMAK